MHLNVFTYSKLLSLGWTMKAQIVVESWSPISEVLGEHVEFVWVSTIPFSTNDDFDSFWQAYSGAFRSDGQVLAAGGQSGIIQV